MQVLNTGIKVAMLKHIWRMQMQYYCCIFLVHLY